MAQNEMFDDFMNELEASNKERESNESKPQIARMYMNTPDSMGSMYYGPVNSKSGKLQTLIEGVREVNCKISADAKFAKWWKLLPRQMYEFADGTAEHRLYEELVSIHEALLKKWTFKNVRFRYYMLQFAWVLKHYAKDSTLLKDFTPHLLVFNGKNFKDTLTAELKSKTTLASSSAWMKNYYSREPKRTAFVKLTINPGTNGTTYSISHSKIDEESMGVSNGSLSYEIPAEFLELMDDHVLTFMVADSHKSLFNIDTYTKLKYVWLSMLDEEVAKSLSDNKPSAAPSAPPPAAPSASPLAAPSAPPPAAPSAPSKIYTEFEDIPQYVEPPVMEDDLPF